MSAAAVDTVPADWNAVEQALDALGHAVLPGLLTAADCAQLAALYADAEHFRRRVVMQQHGYGRGEYQYFRYPLPPPVARLRTALYAGLAPIANRWYERLQRPVRFPPEHAQFIERCHAGGQQRPTPLLARYLDDDHNGLHQDLYGEHVFPLQVAILLAAPGRDFCGGEFILSEQRPRQQARIEVVPLAQGDAVIFPVQQRPVDGARGVQRLQVRHGVARVRSGLRHTLGLIFHDAS